MEITLRQLRYMVALAEEGGFGRAAASVNVSQPALSVQIRELETSLGVELFERRPREVVPTPAGREALIHARRVMEELGELRRISRWRGGLGGRLRLGIIPTVAPYLLPAALPLLRGRDLALDLGVREGQTQALLDELRGGALDAAIVALPIGARDLIEEPLFEDRFLLGGSETQIAALGARPVSPAEMRPDRLLLLEDGHCLTDQALAACALARDSGRLDLRASSLSTLCRLVEEGFGLTLIPELALRVERAAAPGLALRRFSAPEPRRAIGLVRRARSADDGWFSELAQLLSDAGRAEIAHAEALSPPRIAA
ncbi:hydrogen peroxide-inducible genes activator [Amaricoccus solimangrovi]|uniref:Hydrogen peroxide-inducible genes activator n=1 Tax=Amaricoccus solimangrovi TaxID=2589815 RepID=A0A501WP89_9RHOB|nr:hydrogen peroxide-inducible genes activator [Amaricoccus solimangrovi]TPE50160.1 hydrogen peroxide-inducible genes activator [Amaricoccus solimangrovi]